MGVTSHFLFNVLFFSVLTGVRLKVFVLDNLSIGRKIIRKKIFFETDCSGTIENELFAAGACHSLQSGLKPT